MRWKNSRYKEIAKELGVSLDTVKSWFRKDGFLREAYKNYSDEQELIWKLQEKKERINTLNSSKQQQMATNPLNSTISKIFNRLPQKEKDNVMERFYELTKKRK